MDAPPIQYVESHDGNRIAYWTVGDGPPLVFTPESQMGDIQSDWAVEPSREFFSALARDWTVTAFDHRLRGLSDRSASPVTSDDFIADLTAVIDAVADAPVTLVGQLWHTPYALALAAREPTRVRQLVLWLPISNTVAFTNGPEVSALMAALHSDFDFTMRTVVRAVWNPPRSFEAQLVQAAASSFTIEDSSAFLGNAVLDASPELAKLAVPVHIIHRPDNTFVPTALVRELASALGDARIRMVPGDSALISLGDQRPILNVIGALHPGPLHEVPAATSGFRTLMFTDLAASTATTQRLGDAAAQDLVRAHNAIVRQALQTCDGHGIKHTGDGIMAWFPAASNALDCAQAIQQGVTNFANPDLGVKIGINAGEPIAEEDDLYGTAVQIAARVTDQAEAGEIVVTNVVRELVAGKGYLFSEREPAALKGVEEPVGLFTLRTET